MKVFNLFLKLLKTNISFLIIYVGIFVLIISMSVSSNESLLRVTFTPNIYLINNDDDNKVTNGVLEYIDLHAKRVDEVKPTIEEALYYCDIVSIVTIPEGFGESFTTSSPKSINVECGTMSDGYQFMNILNTFISTAHTYYTNGIVSGEDFMSEAVKLYTESEESFTYYASDNSNQLVASVFNMTTYVYLAALSCIVALIIVSLKQTDLRRRLDISAFSTTKRNVILILCNILLGVVVYGICMGVTLIRVRNYEINNLPILLINSALMMVFAVVLGYFLSVIFTSRLIISGVCSVVSLGLAFVTGIFISQETLNPWVNKFGQIFPTHWNIRLTEFLFSGSHSASKIAKECFYSFGIQTLFILLFLGLSIYFSHKNKTKEA